METRVWKSRDGWEARTTIAAPELDQYRPKVHDKGTAELEVGTGKDGEGQVVTCVSVMWCADGIRSFALFTDFMVRPIVTRGRCTEPAVWAQQIRALEMLEQLKADAVAFYKLKGK